ncbi:hypothetical protein N7517_001825 [Penicillium concentricum]|uniref:Uncharacterized protein n=1 Tax=Penicillium concentricum TaxID=293559 RepID=A0A9W9SUR6_9EURO|nr:uncharacterized protein N7517_001825 [Penicillium concentricum]KAJ5383914.1 hypothetical protein N7517_001825 [Penicillium concentricum]
MISLHFSIMDIETDIEWSKVDYEGKLKKAAAAIEAKETALAQQREAAESATQEINSLKGQLAAKEAQIGELREAIEVQAKRLDAELEAETKRVVKYVQKKDAYLRAAKRLLQMREELQADNDDLARDNKNLAKETEDLKIALDDAAGDKEAPEITKAVQGFGMSAD